MPVIPVEQRQDKGAMILGAYRYLLWRRWSRYSPLPPLVWIMLNPSTADGMNDDPTLRRCIGFTKARRHHQGLVVVNLFAYRATDPDTVQAGLEYQVDGQSMMIGGLNDTILSFIGGSYPVGVAAWGAQHWAKERAEHVTALLRAQGMNLLCLGLTDGGHPRHPLFVKGSTDMEKFAG